MEEKITLGKAGHGLYTDRKSEFYGYAVPVSSEEEAREVIAGVRKKHPDARHNVFAYVLAGGAQKRYSDDGEPQGSAGRPVLDVIEKNGLDGVVIVVTRYFGGILLGTGGLVRAYSGAAAAAVEDAGTVRMRVCSMFDVRLSYNDHAKVQNLIAKSGAAVTGTDFGRDVTVSVSILKERAADLRKSITEQTGGRAVITDTGEKLAPSDV